MQKEKFSEEDFRELSKKMLPVIDELRKIAAENGVEEGLRIYISKDYLNVEGAGLGGWELCNYGSEYQMKYERRVPLSLDGENNQ